MKDNLHDVFEVSAYQDAYPKVIDKRADLQNKYYKSCSGIFTMGEWLRDFLIEQGIQKEKVHAVGAGINVKKELIHPQKKTNSKSKNKTFLFSPLQNLYFLKYFLKASLTVTSTNMKPILFF